MNNDVFSQVCSAVRGFPRLSQTEKWYVFVRAYTAPFAPVLRLFPENGRMFLDIGCGAGLLCGLLGVRFKQARITGIDIDRRKIALAEKMGYRAPIDFYAMGPEEYLAKGVETFDAIAAIDVLYLVPFARQQALFKIIFETLAEGGVFILTTMDRRKRLRFFLSYIQELISVRLLKLTYGKDFYFWGTEALQQCLWESGFSRVEMQNAAGGYGHPQVIVCAHKGTIPGRKDI